MFLSSGVLDSSQPISSVSFWMDTSFVAPVAIRAASNNVFFQDL